MRELRLSICRPSAVAYSPDGKLLAVSGQHSIVTFWDVATGNELASVQSRPKDLYHNDFTQVVFSRDGNLLAAAHETNFALWRLPDLVELPVNLPTGAVGCRVAFFPEGKRLAVGWNMQWSAGNTLTSWDVAKASADPLCGDQHHAVPALATSPPGDLIAVGRQIPGRAVHRNCVEFWDVAESCWRSTLELDRTGSLVVRDLCFSPDGKSVATAAGKSASVWDVASGERRFKLPNQPGLVTAACFSADGRALATGCKDGTVRLWDVVGGRQIVAFDWRTGAVRCVAFSPDGMTAAVVGDRHKVVLWDVDGT
jgi:WD40 repeat protein